MYNDLENVIFDNCFRINRDWSFDEAMAKYGCEVHSFDPRFAMCRLFHIAS